MYVIVLNIWWYNGPTTFVMEFVQIELKNIEDILLITHFLILGAVYWLESLIKLVYIEKFPDIWVFF